MHFTAERHFLLQNESPDHSLCWSEDPDEMAVLLQI